MSTRLMVPRTKDCQSMKEKLSFSILFRSFNQRRNLKEMQVILCRKAIGKYCCHHKDLWNCVLSSPRLKSKVEKEEQLSRSRLAGTQPLH